MTIGNPDFETVSYIILSLTLGLPILYGLSLMGQLFRDVLQKD